MNFRDVASSLHGAVMSRHDIDIGAGSFAVAAGAKSAESQVTIEFEDIGTFRIARDSSRPDSIEIAVIGLERLGAGEPWRLYIRTRSGTELELACRRIVAGAEEVTGVGRAYLT